MPITASRGFIDWLTSQNVSLSFTTYQGKLFFIGRNDQGGVSVFERSFERAMGLGSADASANTLYLASLYQIWRLDNVLGDGETADGYDRLYVPQVGCTTGDLDVHDVAVETDPDPAPGGGGSGTGGGGGRVVFISARFSCLAALSEAWHFEPLWMPPFVSRLAAEDRCHLNGLALEDGRARYATACAATDVHEGWRDHRTDGGVVIDIQSDEIIARGLSMPHSPRVYRGKLWLLDSGTGYLGYVDRDTGQFERLTFCPGYARGLAFVGDYAVVGLSRPRHEPTFSGLALENNLNAKQVEPRCGLLVIELATGDVVQWLRFEEPIRELYDVVSLPGAKRPMAYGFKTDEIKTRVWADPRGLATIDRSAVHAGSPGAPADSETWLSLSETSPEPR